jgi:hypothetical protein
MRPRAGRPVSAPVTGLVDSAIRGGMLLFSGAKTSTSKPYDGFSHHAVTIGPSAWASNPTSGGRHDVPSIFSGHYDPSFPIALDPKDLPLIDERWWTLRCAINSLGRRPARLREVAALNGLKCSPRRSLVEAVARFLGSR